VNEDEDRYELSEMETELSFERPPEEAYEIAWRTTLKALEDAGPSAAFNVVIIKPHPSDEGNFLSGSYVSSGTSRIDVTDIQGVVKVWLENANGS
jgi:hypothetical protein